MGSIARVEASLTKQSEAAAEAQRKNQTTMDALMAMVKKLAPDDEDAAPKIPIRAARRAVSGSPGERGRSRSNERKLAAEEARKAKRNAGRAGSAED